MNRFRKDKMGYYPIMYRPCMTPIIDQMFRTLNDILVLDIDYPRIFALSGPQGIGKSHILYLFAAMLKSDPTKRVLYLPECSMLNFKSQSRVFHLLKELRLSFYDDDAQNIIDQFENHRLDFDMLLIRLQDHYVKKKVHVVLVFDQLNTIGNKGDSMRLDIIELLDSMRRCFPIFVSYSANNNVELTESYLIVELQDYEIQESEELAYCRSFMPDITQEEAKEVIALADRTPLEITLCLKSDGNNIGEKCKNYMKNRSGDFRFSFKKYLREQRSEELPEIYNSMFRILMGTNDFLDSYHKKLVKKVEVEYTFFYKFVNALAWNAVFKILLDRKVELDLDSIAGDIFRSNSAKGLEAERYFIMRSIMRGEFHFPWESVELKNFAQFTIRDTLKFDFGTPFLYYPISPNFPGFDFLIYNGENVLYLVNVTLEINSKRHRNKFNISMSNPESNLKLFLTNLRNANMNRNDLIVYEVYIVGGSEEAYIKEIGMDAGFGYNEIPISQFSDKYPALRSLSLRNSTSVAQVREALEKSNI